MSCAGASRLLKHPLQGILLLNAVVIHFSEELIESEQVFRIIILDFPKGCLLYTSLEENNLNVFRHQDGMEEFAR